MRGRRSFTVREFGGEVPHSLYTLTAQPSRYDLPPGAAHVAEDVLLSESGSLIGRDGDLPGGDFATSGIYSAYPLPQSERVLWASTTDIYSMERNTGALTTVVAAAPSSGDPWSFANGPASGGQGPTYAVTTAAARYVNAAGTAGGTWTASTGTLPLARTLLSAGNRMWAGGMTSYGALADPASALVWSELGDPRNWPAANVLMLDPNDGQWITGIGPVGDQIVVFKNRKAWVIYDLDTGANRQISDSIGCADERSIVSTPHGLVFISYDNGLMITDGASMRTLGPVSTEPWHRAPLSYAAVGAYWRDRYLAATPTGIRVYDFERKAWTSTDLVFDVIVSFPYVQGISSLWGKRSGGTKYGRLMAPYDQDTFTAVTTDIDGDPLSGTYEAMLNVDDSAPHRWHEIHVAGTGDISFTVLDPTTRAALSSASQIKRQPSTDSSTAITKDIRGVHRGVLVRISIPSHAEVNSLTAYTTPKAPG